MNIRILILVVFGFITPELFCYTPFSLREKRLVRALEAQDIGLVRRLTSPNFFGFEPIDVRGVDRGFTFLHRACREGSVELVKFLLGTKAKLDINTLGADGSCPLTVPIRPNHGNEHFAIVKLLLKAGARVPDSVMDSSEIERAQAEIAEEK